MGVGQSVCNKNPCLGLLGGDGGSTAALPECPDSSTNLEITADVDSPKSDFPNFGLRERRAETMGRSTSLKYLGGPTLAMRPGTQKTEDEKQIVAESLRKNPNLKKFVQLEEEHIRTLVETAWKESVPVGQRVMVEGSLNNAVFFIVTSGNFEIRSSYPFDLVENQDMFYLSRPEAVFKEDENKKGIAWARPSTHGELPMYVDDDVTVRKGGKKLSFGDSSMFYGTPRWATCTATEESEVWVISQHNFKIVQAQAARGSLSFVSSGEDERLITDALQINANLQKLTPLGSRHIKQLLDVAWKETCKVGQVLMTEGDLNADCFYIIASGKIDISCSESLEVVEQGGSSYLTMSEGAKNAIRRKQGQSSVESSRTSKICGRGCCFGELSMLHCAPRFTSAEVVEEAVVWAIDRSSFQMVQMKAAEEEMKDRVKHLARLSIMATFTKEDKEKVAGSMDTMRFTKGQKLSEKGVTCSTFYVLYDGSCVVTTESGQTEEVKAGSGEVHYFGEKFYEREPALLTCEVTSETASVLVLERDTLSKIWDRLLDAAPVAQFNRFATTARQYVSEEDEFILKNLAPLRLIGRTNLGRVDLLSHKDDLYVMKTMNKGLIVQKGLRKSIMRERRLWMEMVHPFVIRCVATFNEPQDLKLVLEPALGGELIEVYRRFGFFGKAEYARFYTAGVTLALSHLHKRRVVYRNLKPQNVLISQQGHPKLTDMSLAKLVVGHTFTSCGAPNYMAPEVVTGVGHTRAVDWWSLGVLLFELMAGYTPFHSNHPMQIYSKVMIGIKRVNFPDTCKGDVQHLIENLLQPQAMDRLGMGQGGVADIMKHKWYEGLDWDAMRGQTLEPPYVPAWKEEPRLWKTLPQDELEKCLSHFQVDGSILPLTVPYEDDQSGWDEEFESRQGF